MDDSTVAAGRTFLVTDDAGRCERDHHGLYHRETRVLDRYELAVGDRATEPVATLAPRPGERVLHATVPADPPASVRRTRVLVGDDAAAVAPGVYERVEVRNGGDRTLSATLRLAAGTRFDEVLEVQGVVDERTRSIGIVPDDRVAFSYDPDDADVHRRAGVVLDAEAQVDVHGGLGRADAVLGTDLRIDPGDVATVNVAAVAGTPLTDATGAFATARDRVRRRAREWWAGLTPVDAAGERGDVVHRAVEDLLALTVDTGHGPVFAAGPPCRGTLPGRDALLSAYMALPLTVEPAVGTLRYLAAARAPGRDPPFVAEPGETVQDQYRGELAVRGEVPGAVTRGRVDVAPLFVVLLHETWRWTGDDDLVGALWPVLERAIAWLEDRPEGFLTTRGEAGDGEVRTGVHRGAVVHPDGRVARGPLARAAVQGYAYDAMRRAAALYRGVRDAPDRARALDRQAGVLREAFDAAFWLDDEGCYAVAVDGEGAPVRAVTAAPGHCLWSGVVSGARVDAVVDRLLAEDCFSGWGLRSLSAAHRGYDPESRRRGAIRLGDTALAALGMARYDRHGGAERLADGLFGATARADRLPELLAGYGRAERDDVVAPDGACEPQPGAAGAPLACLRATAGIGPPLDVR